MQLIQSHAKRWFFAIRLVPTSILATFPETSVDMYHVAIRQGLES